MWDTLLLHSIHTEPERRLSAAEILFPKSLEEIECLLYDSHQNVKMMIMIVKTPGSQLNSSVAEGNTKEGGGGKMRDRHNDT